MRYIHYKIENLFKNRWILKFSTFPNSFSMFPYPSGDLHIGHIRNYTINDIICRNNNNYMVMGWDSFGLPAENASIIKKKTPFEYLKKNIFDMKKEMIDMGFFINWKFEFKTFEKEFYSINQFFFLKMYELGFIYRKNKVVNWDPIDRTVLSNEQIIKGKGWRSNIFTKKRKMFVYIININKIINILYKGIYFSNIKTRFTQLNWVGKKTFFKKKDIFFLKNKIFFLGLSSNKINSNSKFPSFYGYRKIKNNYLPVFITDLKYKFYQRVKINFFSKINFLREFKKKIKFSYIKFNKKKKKIYTK
ncbi:class I tRNA ligase family protein [Candidatus Vidania fulgoroideorum]